MVGVGVGGPPPNTHLLPHRRCTLGGLAGFEYRAHRLYPPICAYSSDPIEAQHREGSVTFGSKIWSGIPRGQQPPVPPIGPPRGDHPASHGRTFRPAWASLCPGAIGALALGASVPETDRLELVRTLGGRYLVGGHLRCT